MPYASQGMMAWVKLTCMYVWLREQMVFMVFGWLWRASEVDVIGYTSSVRRRIRKSVQVRLRRAVVKLSGTSGKALLA